MRPLYMRNSLRLQEANQAFNRLDGICKKCKMGAFNFLDYCVRCYREDFIKAVTGYNLISCANNVHQTGTAIAQLKACINV